MNQVWRIGKVTSLFKRIVHESIFIMPSALSETVSGLGLPVAFLLAVTFISVYWIRRSKTLIVGLVDAVSVARWFLLAIAYPFVAVMEVGRFLLSSTHGNSGQLCTTIFLAFPLFFIVCWLIGAGILNLVLNMMLYNCYQRDFTVTDREACLRVRKMVKRWLWLHKGLSAVRKTDVLVVLERVCPAE